MDGEILNTDFQRLPEYALFDLIDRLDMDALINIWKTDSYMHRKINKLGKEQLRQITDLMKTDKREPTKHQLFYVVVTSNKLPALLLLLLDTNNPELSDSFWRNRGLVYASESGHLSLVRYFVDKGARDYMDALINATRKGHKDIVKYLEQNWH